MVPARYLVPAEAGLIALDWGTSALRAFHMGAHGEVPVSYTHLRAHET